MEEQSSILLQKKIIFIMTFFILLASFICTKKDLYISNNDATVVAQNTLEIEEEIVSKDVHYLALTEVAEDLVNPVVSEESKIDSTPEPTVDSTGVPADYEEVLSMSATAYCLCQKCCGKPVSHPAYGITASGYKITPGTNDKVIAVDTSVIPLGTKVYVEGLNGANSYGYAVAADTGSAIKNMKIDLYMDSHADALKWGFKKVNVYLLED